MSCVYLGYRADIDGMRAIAVAAVVSFHSAPSWVRGGFIGVDIFFVISGFLISAILLDGLAHGRLSYREFYRRRARRILPSLLVVWTFILGAGWFGLLSTDYAQLARHTLSSMGFVLNFSLWHETGYFEKAGESNPLLHLWSLALEEQFYIFWPVLLGILWKCKRHVLSMMAILCLISFASSIHWVVDYRAAAFYLPLPRFWELMVGGVLAFIHLKKQDLVCRHTNLQSALGLALIACGLVVISQNRIFPGWWVLLPVGGTVLLISAGPAAWFNRTVLASPVAVWLGKISYPLYLWHWPLLSFALIWNNYLPLSSDMRVAIVFVAIVLAWLTYRFVERPIRSGRSISTPALLAVFGFVCTLTVSVMVLDGLPRRAINGDEAKDFLDHYGKFHRYGVSDYYQERCDFRDWATSETKKAIDPACTAAIPGRPVFLLWGDSHAQAISHGFRENLPVEVQLAQIATGGCPPKLQSASGSRLCRISNAFAQDFIARYKPMKVFVAQRGEHELTDWAELASFVRSQGGELVLIGPTPQWMPSLAAIVAKDLKARQEYVSEGLDQGVIATNALLHSLYDGTDVRFVSIIDAICRSDGCRAIVNTEEPLDLLVLDYGHLSPAGADFVVKTTLRTLLQSDPLLPPRP